MEKGTRIFYSSAAAKAVHPVAQKMYGELSDWEEEHMEFIQYLYQSFSDDRDIKNFEHFRDVTDAPVAESGIPVKELEAKIEKYAFDDDEGAMRIALQTEGQAYNLYRKLSQDAPDSNARVVFKEMMEQELKHIAYLKKMGSEIA
jgi:rubrerythrin